MITQRLFDTLPDGQTVECYTLTNAAGVEVELLTLGAIVRSWKLADAAATDIVLGYDSLQEYLSDSCYFGATVGRYANRIAGGNLILEGVQHKLSCNLDGNCLHGGEHGFNSHVWQARVIDEGSAPSLCLSLTSADGEQGFPANLVVKAIFTLDESNTLKIRYEAQSDGTTVFNPTQHSYFNLSGHDAGDVRHTEVTLHADYYTPADSSALPTGKIAAVDATPFDLRKGVRLNHLITHANSSLQAAHGPDHNWCISGYQFPQQALREAAVIDDKKARRRLIVTTTMPGMQLYAGNFIGAGTKGKQGAVYGPYHGVCAETQYYPDSPNHPSFPSATLEKEQLYSSETHFKIEEY